MGGGGDDDATRRLILARRAKFVAAALATVACGKSGGSGDGCGPRPCLEPPIVAIPDADQPSPPPTQAEAGMMFFSDAGAPDGASPQTPQNPDAGDAGPRQARDGGGATTKIKPKRPPEPCLNVYLDNDDK